MITINLIGIISYIGKACATITIVSVLMGLIAILVYEITKNEIAYNILIICGYVALAMVALAFIYMMVYVLYIIWTC